MAAGLAELVRGQREVGHDDAGTAHAFGQHLHHLRLLSGGFHPVAAVYVVTRRTGGTGADRHEVLYVGETGHLAEHFRDHPKAECFARHRAHCVGVHRQDDPRGRRETVGDLVAELEPPCNDQG